MDFKFLPLQATLLGQFGLFPLASPRAVKAALKTPWVSSEVFQTSY